jgi:hypothetical protein
MVRRRAAQIFTCVVRKEPAARPRFAILAQNLRSVIEGGVAIC